MRMDWDLGWVGVSQVVGRDGAFRYLVMGTPLCLGVLKRHSERAGLVMESGTRMVLRRVPRAKARLLVGHYWVRLNGKPRVSEDLGECWSFGGLADKDGSDQVARLYKIYAMIGREHKEQLGRTRVKPFWVFVRALKDRFFGDVFVIVVKQESPCYEGVKYDS